MDIDCESNSGSGSSSSIAKVRLSVARSILWCILIGLEPRPLFWQDPKSSTHCPCVPGTTATTMLFLFSQNVTQVYVQLHDSTKTNRRSLFPK